MNNIIIILSADAVQAVFDNYGVINGSTNLEVNLTSESFLNNNFSKLVWYYNEYPIFSSNNSNFLGHNTTLITPVYDGGGYGVRYEGLLTVPYNSICEKDVLDALQYYPTFRSAAFKLKKGL